MFVRLHPCQHRTPPPSDFQGLDTPLVPPPLGPEDPFWAQPVWGSKLLAGSKVGNGTGVQASVWAFLRGCTCASYGVTETDQFCVASKVQHMLSMWKFHKPLAMVGCIFDI